MPKAKIELGNGSAPNESILLSFHDGLSSNLGRTVSNMVDPGRKALVVGISGASSSGKTTLSRLLCDIFPNTFVLHEDDFYKPEKE
jgi:pantothenate kinase-related protein Tda10